MGALAAIQDDADVDVDEAPAAGSERRFGLVRDPEYGRGSARALLIGHNIARWRNRHGLSQSQLARALGCDHAAISRWENGQRLPNLPTLLALGQILGCGAAALLPDER